jgi:hypothetical protein
VTGKAIVSPLWPALLAAVSITVAQGQNATPSGTQSANQSSTPSAPDASSSTTPGTSTGTGNSASAPPNGSPSSAGPKTGTGSTPAAGNGNKPPPVCFKLTGHCVDSSKAPATKGTATADGSTKRPLNLTAPDVRSVVPADELKEPLPNGDQVTEVQEDETVSVKGTPNAPDVPGGFGALWWAVNHPSQAWRILAPAE